LNPESVVGVAVMGTPRAYAPGPDAVLRVSRAARDRRSARARGCG
jgi:hypothetical protein